MANLRLALRLLFRSPGFSATAILTLALGIGANTAIFSVIHAVLLRPLPYPEADRLVVITETKKGQPLLVAGRDLLQWQQQSHTIESFAFWPDWRGSHSFQLPGGDRAELLEGVTVPSSFFKTLKVEPILGRAPTADEDKENGPLGVLLGYNLWQRRFSGDPSIIGKSITLDQFWRREHTVLGILPPGFNFPDKSELWVTQSAMELRMTQRGNYYKTVARLKPSSSREAAQAELNTFQNRTAAESPKEEPADGVQITSVLDYEAGPQTRPALLVLLGAVALLLLIACANVSNLLLARGAARQKEIAIRLALGASRRKILSQLLTESGVLAAAGAVAGILLAYWSLHALTAFAAQEIPNLGAIKLNFTTLAFTIAISTVAALFFGLAPALQLSKTSLEPALRQNAHSSHSRSQNHFRSALLVAELSLTVLLLVGAGLMLKSFSRLQNVPLGFNPDQIITAEFDLAATNYYSNGRDRVFFDQLTARLQSHPGVQSVSGTWYLPVIGRTQPSEAMTVEKGNRKVMTAWNAITPGYFDTLAAPIVKGRAFNAQDGPNAPRIVIVNETAARQFFPGENPIGQRLAMGAPGEYRDVDRKPHWREIIGVVRDIRPRLDTEPFPEAYFDYRDWPWHRAFLVVRAHGSAAPLASVIRNEVNSLNHDQPISSLRTMSEIIGQSTGALRFRTLLLGLFSAAALLLSVVGLYGVISYIVAQRTHEFGIRIALGATARDLFHHVLKNACVLITVGLITGIFASLAFAQLLRKLLYEVQPTDPTTIATAALILAAVALLACFFPARRASKVEPLTALRTE